MSKLKSCKSCGKEISKSAKSCPHCGQKLKHGLCVKILAAGVALGVVIGLSNAIFGPSDEEIAAQKQAMINELIQTPVANYTPTGELQEMFSLGSSYTDLQRENKLKELAGQVVHWTVPVYEVKKGSKYYTIQTKGDQFTAGYVGLFLRVETEDPNVISYLENLKTNDMITFKGKFTGDSTMRNLELSPVVVQVQ